ncbi:ABC transporter substrate-binding protein [Dictyobacter kobayashii]|uniref:ABC transporter substrate-binding protein n=1 Tax=Dictyobacter kobayashii TaxID=2014872 RepID=A0A402AV17_9CHLR|nr:sugar ABC transporter substrate-binding protein [Dictyobacter kobayashii]GCE22927.1 ABC transporter substrate-binding protein [Dictyobacter kobayashii]
MSSKLSLPDSETINLESSGKSPFLSGSTTRRQFLVRAAGTAAATTGMSALAAALSGCGTPNVNTGKGQAVLNFYHESTPGEVLTYKKIIAKFEAANPNIKIQLQSGNNGAHLQKFNTQLAGGSPPDITRMWEIDYGGYAKKGVFLDLNTFIDKDNQFAEKVKPDIYPDLAKLFTWENKFYVMPDQLTTVALFYNKDHVREAGLTMPSSWTDTSWTWDKFTDYAGKLGQTSAGRTTRYGYAEAWNFAFSATCAVAVANGGHWFGDKAINPGDTDSNLSDPKVAQAIQWYADLSNVKKVAAAEKSLQSQSGYQLFQTGKASMCIVGHWFYDAFSQTSGLNFDIAPVPVGPSGSRSGTNLEGTGISIVARSQYPDEAWRFVKYWGGPEANLERLNWLPTLKSVGSSAEFKKANAALDHATLFTEALEVGAAAAEPVSRAWPNFSTDWLTILDDIWNGKKSAADLKALDSKVNKAIQAYG